MHITKAGEYHTIRKIGNSDTGAFQKIGNTNTKVTITGGVHDFELGSFHGKLLLFQFRGLANPRCIIAQKRQSCQH
jgi:hypothetical protein